MKVPAFLSSYVDGDSPKRLFQGLALGVIGTMVIGFNWGGWQLGSSVDERVNTATQAAKVSALAPICADKFQRAAKSDSDLFAQLTAVSSWQREGHLKKAGWATFPGGAEPDSEVAKACGRMIIESL